MEEKQRGGVATGDEGDRLHPEEEGEERHALDGGQVVLPGAAEEEEQVANALLPTRRQIGAHLIPKALAR